MPDSDPRRTRFSPRFGLRTLMVVVTGCAALFGIQRWISHPFRIQQRAREHFESLQCIVEVQPADPKWMAWLVGSDRYLRVTSLTAANSRLRDESLEQLDAFPWIQKLWLGSNRLSDDCIEYVAECDSLREVDLSGTNITNQGLSQLSNLKNLEAIEFPQSISKVDLAPFAKLRKLRKIRADLGSLSVRDLDQLADCQIESVGFLIEPERKEDWDAIKKLKHLKEFNVLVCRDAGYVFELLSNLPKLVSIRATSPSIDDTAVVPLRKLQNLHFVHLARTRIGRKGLESLCRMGSVREIQLESSLLTMEEVALAADGCDHLRTCFVYLLLNEQASPPEELKVKLDSGWKPMQGLLCAPIRSSGSMLGGDFDRIHNAWLIPSDLQIDKLKGRKFINLAPLEGTFDFRRLSVLDDVEELVLPDIVDDGGLRQVSELTQLRLLTVHSSRITSTGVRHLAALENLEALVILGTWITMADNKWLEQKLPNTNLTFVGIDNEGKHRVATSQVTGVTTSAYAASLEHWLDTASTWNHPLAVTCDIPIGREGLRRLADSPFIEELYHNFDDTCELTLDDLLAFRQVKKLHLNDWALTDDELAQLAQLDLKSLRLDGSTITQAALRHLNSMPLESLKLGWWGVDARKFFAGESHLDDLKDIDSLRELVLDAALVDDDELESISEIKQLTHLEISGESISKAGIEHLLRLRDLEFLKITMLRNDKPLTEDDFACLQQLPKLKTVQIWIPGLDRVALKRVLPDIELMQD